MWRQGGIVLRRPRLKADPPGRFAYAYAHNKPMLSRGGWGRTGPPKRERSDVY